MLKLYGQYMSRAQRCLWTLEELGVPYEHVKTNQGAGESRTPEFLKINPNGHVPALQDGDFILWESMAIAMYLARKYGQGSLWPSSVEDEGYVLQWALWASLEMEIFVVNYLRHAMIYPPEKRRPELVKEATDFLPTPLRVLNDSLAGKDYLVGNRFSVADINVATVLLLADIYKQLGVDQYPNIMAWLNRVSARPAWQKLPSLK
ncbi:glutathione S-transferase family protein [Immundisolibacter sp.]|uniref:glutathione S-transferase family protein n=1 Tax=Immundisolibacter sp. TaxID=1934948 RepID=UPI00356219C4